MSHGPAAAADPAAPGSDDSSRQGVDWTRIERSPEFRELTARRHRFLFAASVVTFGCFGLYLGLATFAVDFMGTTVGGVPIAWLAAMSQVFLTWAVTWAYLRKADREFTPLERRVAEVAGPRFMRADAADAPTAETSERSAR
jgi:uncharacterized membrane protein (DUF485 family)